MATGDFLMFSLEQCLKVRFICLLSLKFGLKLLMIFIEIFRMFLMRKRQYAPPPLPLLKLVNSTSLNNDFTFC